MTGGPSYMENTPKTLQTVTSEAARSSEPSGRQDRKNALVETRLWKVSKRRPEAVCLAALFIPRHGESGYRLIVVWA